jgi:hypothetical protein
MFVAQVKDRETGKITLIKSTEFCKTKKEFKDSLKQYYIVKQIIEL